jgi:MFS family permease
VVVIGAIMSILDTTIVNVALATLGRDLHASLATVQWVSTGYLVALAMAITMTGWASERFGLSSPTACGAVRLPARSCCPCPSGSTVARRRSAPGCCSRRRGSERR